MFRRLILPLIFGTAGTAVLIVLGTWQLERLWWKEGVIAQIESRLDGDPVAVPSGAHAVEHQYLRVRADGVVLPGELHVYTSVPPYGVGYRVIAPFELADGRRILLDRGFVPIDAKDASRPVGEVSIEGALHWPQESDRFTAKPDRSENIWFARDVPMMAEALGTEPVMLVVARSSLAGGPVPQPVSVNIPNRHLEYVVTWYGLAVVWIGMTIFWLRRNAQRGPELPDTGARP